jgi:DNA-binding GntR family transcriptional regulator
MVPAESTSGVSVLVANQQAMSTTVKHKDLDDPTPARGPLHDDVVGRLREMIITCELQPGERLTEQKLVEVFGVSRTPLREALKVLSSEGLIELRPNRGSVVAPILVNELAQTFDVMGALEEFAGPRVCEWVSNVDIAKLDALTAEMHSTHDAADRSRYFALNVAFHQTIVELSANEVLANTYRHLFGKLQRARFLVNFDQDRWDASEKEHSWIMDALRQRDGAELGLRLKEHNSRTATAVLARLASSPSPRS